MYLSHEIRLRTPQRSPSTGSHATRSHGTPARGSESASGSASGGGALRTHARQHTVPPCAPGPARRNPRADAWHALHQAAAAAGAAPRADTRCIRLQRRPVQSSVERAALVAEARPAHMRQARAWHTHYLRIRSRRPALRGPAAALLPHSAGVGPMWPVTTWCRP